MTSETRTTIQMSDIRGVEFECTQCHAKIVRPITTWNSPLVCCPDCGVPWNHFRGTMDFLAKTTSQLSKTSALDTQADAPFIVRFEIATEKKP